MSSEQMQKFKEIVENSNTIAIRVGETNDISKILAGAMLHQAFFKLGKKVSSDIQNTETVSAFFEAPFANFAAEENILIKFDTEKLPISELRYEKEGKLMKIILKSAGGAHSTPDLHEILLEKETLPVDLLILIDTPEAEIENVLKANTHKEVVKLGAKDKNLSCKTGEILNVFFEKIPAELNEALWFFTKYEERMDWNISGGLREEKIINAKEALFGQNFWKLFGRALARSHFDKEIKTLWTFLPQSDFEKTGVKENSVLKILNELRALRPESTLFAMLWGTGDTKTISAVIAGRDRTLLTNLAVSMSSAPASSYFFVNGFQTFSEAELKIRSAVRKVL